MLWSQEIEPWRTGQGGRSFGMGWTGICICLQNVKIQTARSRRSEPRRALKRRTRRSMVEWSRRSEPRRAEKDRGPILPIAWHNVISIEGACGWNFEKLIPLTHPITEAYIFLSCSCRFSRTMWSIPLMLTMNSPVTRWQTTLLCRPQLRHPGPSPFPHGVARGLSRLCGTHNQLNKC